MGATLASFAYLLYIEGLAAGISDKKTGASTRALPAG